VLSRWSLRARLTVVATVLLGLGIAAGAALLAATVSRTLQAAVDAGALQSAREVAALVESEQLPDPVPVGGEGTASIQVVDAARRVRAASANTDRLVPVLRPDELAAVRTGRRLVVDGDRLGFDGPLRVVGVPAGPAGDPQTVVVAVDYSSARSGVRLLMAGLAIGAPLLLAVVGLATWVVVGRALRPVEALRRGAEEITGAGGSRRLPLPSARDEVWRLAVTLNDMLARLDGASARQRAFVSDAAHELRSPLASARTQLEVAARVDAGTAAGALAADVLADVERLGRLVDDLLLLARVDEAPARRREPVDLSALALDAVARYPGARVPVLLAPAAAGVAGGVMVRGDGVALRRVLTNLVDNAVRHARTGVCVTVRSAPASAVLSVTDDGPGVPAEDRERVFDRFTRLDPGRGRDAGGAGLGLAIVRELVRAHGGTVALEDAEPGLRAVVTLPTGHRPEQGKGAGDAVRRPLPPGGVPGAVGGSEPEG
jgi:signal transduction histidine kinase